MESSWYGLPHYCKCLGNDCSTWLYGNLPRKHRRIFRSSVSFRLNCCNSPHYKGCILYTLSYKRYSEKRLYSINKSINYSLLRINDKGKRSFLLFYGVVYLLILSNILTEHNVSVKEEPP